MIQNNTQGRTEKYTWAPANFSSTTWAQKNSIISSMTASTLFFKRQIVHGVFR